MTSCRRERDVLDLIATGRWPEAADADLVEHAGGCGVCRDLAVAAGAIAELRDASVPAPPLPDASVVWYRAHARARDEAARRAAQPFLVMQGLSLATLVGLLLAWWGWGAPGLGAFGAWAVALVPELPAWRIDPAWTDHLVLPALRIAGAAVVIGGVLLSIAASLARLADRPHRRS